MVRVRTSYVKHRPLKIVWTSTGVIVMGAQFSSVSASKCESHLIMPTSTIRREPQNDPSSAFSLEDFCCQPSEKASEAFRTSRKYDTTQKQNPDFPVSPKESDLLPPTNTITHRNAATSRNRFDSPRSLQEIQKDFARTQLGK